jgi:hypothetical protein
VIPQRLRRFLRLQRLSAGLVGLTFGVLISILANWLSDQWARYIPILVVLLIVSTLAALALYMREPFNPVKIAIRAPITIHNELDARQYARPGFVGFVPYYTPRWSSPASKLDSKARQKAIEALDFAALDIENSNLMPTVQAIISHKERLKHCWLIATAGQEGEGSGAFTSLLINYLQAKHGIGCKFHHGDAYTVNLESDAELPRRIYDRVLAIFGEAERIGLSPQELVVDVTTGIRSMALGATLACLDAEHTIEFVGTAYDNSGNPAGPLYPIIFNFEALPGQ